MCQTKSCGCGCNPCCAGSSSADPIRLPGLKGDDGSSLSYKQTELASGDIVCANGGYLIEIAKDPNNTGIYDSAFKIAEYKNCNGIDGASGVGTNGENGVGIINTARTSGDGSSGTFDTYTIYYSDGSTSTFPVYNGADGNSGGGGTNGTAGIHGRGIAVIQKTTEPTNSDVQTQYASSKGFGETNGGDVDTDLLQAGDIWIDTTP
jgi:hypothetical protein